jgi:hypothetical protein
MKKNNTLIWVFAILTMIVICLLYFDVKYDIGEWLRKTPEVDTVYNEKIDTLWKDTTITQTELVPTYIEIVKRDTVYKNGKPIELLTENKTYNDTIECAEDTAVVTSYISGVNPNLDSLKVKLSRREIIKTNTITITKYIEKKKTFLDRFHIGVQGGYGYGFNYKGLEPYIGLGGSFDI